MIKQAYKVLAFKDNKSFSYFLIIDISNTKIINR